MNETRQKGNFTGGFILFGYRVKDKKVIIQPDEAEVVRHVFEECAAGMLVKDIISELHEKGILNRGKPFARNTVYKLLQNEKYAGICRHGDEVFTNIYPRIVPENVFTIVKNKIDNNKYGKHKPNVCYLLKNKLICGYCGKPVNSDSGTSKSGAIIRYYKCSGKRAGNGCEQVPIRKDLLEQLVVDVTCKALASVENIDHIAERILEVHRKRLDDQSILNLLTTEYNNTNRAINNILNAMEQGIITGATKERLENLETKRIELSDKLATEKAKSKLLISKQEIMQYLQTAIRKEPRQMIDLLVRQVVLYRDKIEIYYNYTNRSPDDDRRDLLFYSCKRSSIVDQRKNGLPSIILDFLIELYI